MRLALVDHVHTSAAPVGGVDAGGELKEIELLLVVRSHVNVPRAAVHRTALDGDVHTGVVNESLDEPVEQTTGTSGGDGDVERENSRRAPFGHGELRGFTEQNCRIVTLFCDFV